MNESAVDVLDPEYRSFENVMARREGYLRAMRHLDELCRSLSRQADDDHRRRLVAEPEEDRARREERQRTLRELVTRANATNDPGEADRLWAAVDAMVRPGAA